MNIDTGEFRAFTGQAEELAALGRKISTLTGRVTVMGDRLNLLSGLVEDGLKPLVQIVDRLIDDTRATVPREPGRQVTPERDRHLRLVEGGKP